MQEPRRWRRLRFHLLPVMLQLLALGCGGAKATPAAPVDGAGAPSPSSSQPAPAKGVEEARDAPAAETNAAPVSSLSAASPSTAPPLSTVPLTAPPDLPVGTKVLQVGDSFAAALGIELGKRLRAAGVRTSLEYKTASYVPTWAYGPELPKLVANYNPDLVLVTLGANEIEITDPAQRAGAIQRLVKKLGDRPCAWILPPLWKPDTGLMQVIKDHATPCKVLDSTALVKDLPRGPDHIHPNAEGREAWAQAVFDWLKRSRAPNGPKPWTLTDTPL